MKIQILTALLLISINLHVQPYDADADAFFNATGITDAVQKTAVNQLVLSIIVFNTPTIINSIEIYL